MKLKANMPMIKGRIITGVMTTDHPASQEGKPVLLIENGYFIGPEDAALAEYQVLEADEAELEALKAGGYDFSTF